MNTQKLLRHSRLFFFINCVLPVLANQSLQAQNTLPQDINFSVTAPNQRLEMIVNSSRIFTLDAKIPKAQVNNPELLSVTPLAEDKIQVSAIKAGVTQVNLWSEGGDIHTVDIVIIGDGRELQMLLESEFPNSAIKVRPLASSVVLSGYVDRPEAVSRIVAMAEDYYPRVINNITVGGVQQVKLKVKVYEVSRTKLRTLGVDFAAGDSFISSVSGIINPLDTSQAIGQTLTFGTTTGNFIAYIEALRQNNLAKLSAEPNLVTVSGRPASFLSGGEVPIPVASGLGTASTEFKQFGTRVDFVPIVLGNGHIRLEIRPEVSEPDFSVALNGTPGFRTRWVDTAVEMKAGQTLALAGLIQEKIDTENRGVPYVSDIPWIGAAFRRVQDRRNEVELLITVTPELVGALNPEEVPCEFPGSNTGVLSDTELYWRGYTEVPNCNPQCLNGSTYHGGGYHPGSIEEVPQGNSIPDMPSNPNGALQTEPTIKIQPRQSALRPTRVQSLEPVGRMQMVSNRYTPRPIQSKQQSLQKQPVESKPGLIGPIGFEEIKF